MKIKVNQLEKSKVAITVELENENANIDKLIQYIKEFEKSKVVETKDNERKTIEIEDILYFYSDKKYNYCKTEEGEFKIKSKLYELEKMDINFLRISKSCVINLRKVKHFDLGETGKIVVKFYDNSEQIVSRRKIRDVMDYLEERGI